ncbi:hypothetical protein NL676_027070 [Syzygium grande]|nr:hypothetical protein NL676_027070 [Syzygium grande]
MVGGRSSEEQAHGGCVRHHHAPIPPNPSSAVRSGSETLFAADDVGGLIPARAVTSPSVHIVSLWGRGPPRPPLSFP